MTDPSLSTRCPLCGLEQAPGAGPCIHPVIRFTIVAENIALLLFFVVVLFVGPWPGSLFVFTWGWFFCAWQLARWNHWLRPRP